MTQQNSVAYWGDKRVLVTGASGMVGSWLTRWLAARIRNFWKQFAMALAHARDAAALAPERVMVWVTMAECQAALGLIEAARQSIGQALVLVPDHPPALEVLRGIHEAGWMGGFCGLIRRWSGRP
jgi:tetratricopeptide (TPR) repeat protein